MAPNFGRAESMAMQDVGWTIGAPEIPRVMASCPRNGGVRFRGAPEVAG